MYVHIQDEETVLNICLNKRRKQIFFHVIVDVCHHSPLNSTTTSTLGYCARMSPGLVLAVANKLTIFKDIILEKYTKELWGGRY